MLSRPTPQPLSRRNLLKAGGAAAAVGAFGLRQDESFADGDPPPTKPVQPNRGGSPPCFVGHKPEGYIRVRSFPHCGRDHSGKEVVRQTVQRYETWRSI